MSKKKCCDGRLYVLWVCEVVVFLRAGGGIALSAFMRVRGVNMLHTAFLPLNGKLAKRDSRSRGVTCIHMKRFPFWVRGWVRTWQSTRVHKDKWYR